MALTYLGLVAEQLVRAFWPVWTIVFIALIPLLFGWHDLVSLEILWGAAVVISVALLWAIWRGLRQMRLPSRADAFARVDGAIPGRPIAAIADRQAIGSDDPDSRAVWQAHLTRMQDRTRAAQPVSPNLQISSRDPYGLRYMALIGVMAALMFGSVSQVGSVTDGLTGEVEQNLASGPTWEGWVEPPNYTGKPVLYLADIEPGVLTVPQGSLITIRLYGDAGALSVTETVSDQTEEIAPDAVVHEFAVSSSGNLTIDGPGGAAWVLRVLADAAPEVTLNGPIEAAASGEMSQPFAANDDYGVISGTAVIELDLAQVDRRHGLTAEPDSQEPLILDLPMPFTGGRDAFEEVLVDDLSQHPWANLPVTITLSVTDEAGQNGSSETSDIILPGRRFFEPMARALVEQRRDLIWSKSNAPRVLDVLRAVSHRPDDTFRRESTYLTLSVALRRLDTMIEAGFTDADRDEIAQVLWDLAIQLEDGTLADARERLERAQERLAEAMRNGASDEEIAELMQELREATNDYMNMLAENAETRNNTDEPDQGDQDTMEFSMSELQELMDRIQELMEEGRMAEAEQLMEQLNQLMQNMEIVLDPNAQGGPGQQSMQDLADTLREQQGLSDDAFRELQEQFNEGGQQGEEQGQQPGDQQGDGQGQGDNSVGGQQQDNGAGGEGAGDQPGGDSLAERQQALRDELNRQRGNLPNLGGEEADAARDALDRAEGAMDRAEEALREGDLAEAIDQQGRAMNALRDGLQSLGDAIAENENADGLGEEGNELADQRQPAQSDPLGRESGQTGRAGSDDAMLQGEDIYRRAEELLDEIRRRSADQERPESELDYLKRLLDRF